MNKHILLVHAHPDDESIGQGATMAKYAAEGIGVTLVTCTGGEEGEILVPELEHLASDKDDKLADQRKLELDNAMKELGVTDHRYLGGFGKYRDSGMAWHEDGHAVAGDNIHEKAFWVADLTEAANDLVAVIREVRPQVMVTYDEFGGYGHPDHIQAHRVATYAASLAAVPSYRRDLGEPWDIAKIYWGAMSASRMREGLRHLRESGDTTFEGMDPDGPLPPFITEDENLAAVIDGGEYTDAKIAAMKAHATQITVDGPFFALSNNIGNEVWGSEFFRLAKGTLGPTNDQGLETDLFAGPVVIFDDDNEGSGGPVAAIKESRGGKLVTLLLLGILVLLAAVYALLYGLAGDRMPRGVTIEGVKVGGLHPAAAESKLRKELGPRSSDQIVLTHEGVKQTLTPEAAGLSIDYPASVEEAGGKRSLSPGCWDYYTGGDKHEAVLVVDEDKIGAAVTSLSKAFGQPAVEGTIQFVDGTPKAVYSKPGIGLDPVRGRKAIEDQFLHSGTREVRLTKDDPYISDDAVDRAMTAFAKPAMSGPVTLKLGGQEVVAPPKLFGKALSMIPNDRELQGVVNGEKLLKVLEPVMTTVGTKPADASFKVVNGKPEIVPAKVGATFNIDDLETKFPTVVTQPAGKRSVEVQAAVVQPKFTTEAAKKLGIKEQVSTFTTHFPYANYRNVNLSRAAQLINGTVLKPGETFSLNKTVGERTDANGFTEGFIIKNGLFRKELGGGVSQIATTTFNAMFFAGLEDVEHKPHSVYISRYPEGREATVAWPSLDLSFKNTTPYGVLITARVGKASPGSQGSATVSMYSTKYWDIGSRKSDRYAYTGAPTRYLDAPDCEASGGGPGFQIDVFRDFRKVGSKAVVRTEKFHTVYNPEPRLICGEKRAPKPPKPAPPAPPAG